MKKITNIQRNSGDMAGNARAFYTGTILVVAISYAVF